MTRTHRPRSGGAPVASPCRGTCAYDAAAGRCLDCGRLGSEVEEWKDAGSARRLEIAAAAARRVAAKQQAG